jgi:hypothetical protein
MEDFIIPESVRQLEMRLKVTSNQTIPAFNPSDAGCSDEGLSSISSVYESTTTNADFILLLGAVNKPDEGYLAYATFCVLGKFFNNKKVSKI